MDILKQLKEINYVNSCVGIKIVPTKTDNYWSGLPVYAKMYIKPAYDLLYDLEGMIVFCHYFMIEKSHSNNEIKIQAIGMVVQPMMDAIRNLPNK